MSVKINIVLDNIRSAWNVGSIIRTCDAVGASLILVGYTPQPAGQSLKLIVKTSIGAENTVPWVHFVSFQEVFEQHFDTNCIHLAIDITENSQDLLQYLNDLVNRPENRFLEAEMDTEVQVFLWFGNEIHGLQSQIMQRCQQTLHLPMAGLKESLNVANSVTAVAYLLAFTAQMWQKKKPL